jgi:hypothetical protein
MLNGSKRYQNTISLRHIHRRYYVTLGMARVSHETTLVPARVRTSSHVLPQDTPPSSINWFAGDVFQTASTNPSPQSISVRRTPFTAVVNI